MKFFISSIITGIEPFRDAATAAVESLGHEVIRAEDFAAAPNSPQKACLAAVREANAIILLLSERYGAKQPSGYSATNEEFLEAQDQQCPVFAFVQQGATFEPEQAEFVKQVRSWTSGNYTGGFSDVESLRQAITMAIHRWEIAQTAGTVDAEEMKNRSFNLLPEEPRGFVGSRTSIAVAFVGGPPQGVLRPSQLESEDLKNQIVQQALFGNPSIFTTNERTNSEIDGHTLIIKQESSELKIDEQGSITIIQSIVRDDTVWQIIIEEDVKDTLIKVLNFASQLLDRIDKLERLSHIAIVAKFIGSDHPVWRTLQEHTASPNTFSMGSSLEGTVSPVHLSPIHRPRAEFRQHHVAFAEDLTVLLKRQCKR